MNRIRGDDTRIRRELLAGLKKYSTGLIHKGKARKQMHPYFSAAVAELDSSDDVTPGEHYHIIFFLSKTYIKTSIVEFQLAVHGRVCLKVSGSVEITLAKAKHSSVLIKEIQSTRPRNAPWGSFSE